jgi:riboflavin transporter FmnP
MRAESFVRATAHHVKPLLIRGGLAHTFGSLASFLAILFLLFGLYLLGDAFEHPLAAQPGAVLAAALSITLAAILLYFLCKPRYGRRPRSGRFRRAE